MCNEEAEWNSFETEVIKIAGNDNILICGDMKLELVANMIMLKVTHSCLYTCPQLQISLCVNVTHLSQSRHLTELCIRAHLSILNGRH